MDNTIHEQEASNMQHQKSSLAAPPSILAGILNWLASLIKFTEEEREDAGIYIGRPGGE